MAKSIFIIPLAIALLFLVPIHAETHISFYNDIECSTPVSFTVNGDTSGNCTAIEQSYTAYKITALDSGCGVTMYNENNSFCGLGIKFLVEPNTCYPRNGTDQLTVDCTTASSTTTTSTSTSTSASTSISSSISISTSTSTSSTTSPTDSTTSPTPTSIPPIESKTSGPSLAVTLVPALGGLALTCVGLYIGWKSYKKDGVVKVILQRANSTRSALGKKSERWSLLRSPSGASRSQV